MLCNVHIDQFVAQLGDCITPTFHFSFGRMYLAGERCDIGTLEWVRDTLKLDPVDHFWQTGTLNFKVLDDKYIIISTT